MPESNSETECKCDTSKLVWVLFFFVIGAIVVHYFITFKIWNIAPAENYTNSDYYNENDYYKQYQ